MSDIKLASESQKKLFFALCSEGDYNSEDLKERAKTLFKLQHFNEITSEQISELIDKLQSKINWPDEEEKKFEYKFGISIMASQFEHFKKMFSELSGTMKEFTGEELKVDALIQIASMNMTTKKEMTSKQIEDVEKILKEGIAEKLEVKEVQIKLIK